MATKKTVTISKVLADQLLDALANYQDLLQTEISSSINDQVLIDEYDKTSVQVADLVEGLIKQAGL